MKAKKLLALTLAFIMALSCLSLNAFAEPQPYGGESFSKDITINVPEITIGTTATQVKEGVTFADNTIANDLEIVDAMFFVSPTEIADSVATSGKYYLQVMLKIKNPTATYGAFDMDGVSTDYAYKKTVMFSGKNQFADTVTGITNEFDLQTHIACANVENTSDPYIFCCTVKSFELYDATLDLDDSTTDISDTTTVNQTYIATVTANNTDVTKVQVSWKLEKISVSVTSNKVWNTEKFQWDDDTSKTNGATASDPTATFDFVNLSSKDIYAQLTFAKDSGIKTEPTKSFTENSQTAGAGDGIIKLGTKATSKDTDNTGKIALKLTVTDSDFDNAAAGSGTYGTYTVKISEYYPVSFVFKNFFDGKAGNATVNEMNASQLCQYMVDAGMIADASEFGDVLVKTTYQSKVLKTEVTTARKLSLLFDDTHRDFVEGADIFNILEGDNDYTSDKSLEPAFNGTFIWDGSSFVKKS